MTTRITLEKPSQFTRDRNVSRENSFVNFPNIEGDRQFLNLNDIVLYEEDDINAILSSSFLLGADKGLVSTQQLKVDFSDFTNHTFFNSAIVNTNVAFDKILNQYPFDGTRADIIKFFEKLTGFERWVFNNFPTNTGLLPFSGGLSQSITINDFAHLQRVNNRDYGAGTSVLNPGKEKSFTIESHIFLPKIANKHEFIIQKLSSSINAVSLMLSASTDTTTGTIFFAVSSGSHNLFTSASVDKGKFNHIVASLNREDNIHKIEMYVDEKLISSTSSRNIERIDFNTSSLIIGSGSTHNFNGINYIPTQTFSGALDELRIWHSTRSIEQQILFRARNAFAQKDLKLCFRFNEPINNPSPATVIDYSGNGLHGAINLASGLSMRSIVEGAPLSSSLRATASFTSSMTHENKLFSPILYSQQSQIIDFKEMLITSASEYDNQNTNLITRLIPEHYFNEGAVFESQRNNAHQILGELETFDNKLQSAQIISSFLYVIAKAFDELKIFIDQFKNILSINYDEFETAPDVLINKVADFYGLQFTSFFENATFRQFFFNEDLTVNDEFVSLSLLEIRDALWKRIFANLPDILKSKGTMHAIKSFMRALGVNPNNFRIREFGGSSVKTLDDSARLIKSETATLLDLSSSAGNRGYIKSQFLTASSMTINNYNKTKRQITDVLRTGQFQGLLTSQSFTIEQIFKFPQDSTTSTTQSISRLATTGSLGGVAGFSDFSFNLVAFSSSLSETSSSVKLFVKPFNALIGNNQDRVVITLSGVNVVNNNKWNAAYGKRLLSNISSSYFIYLSELSNDNKINTIHSASFNLLNTASSGINVLTTFANDINISSSFIIIGNSGTSGPAKLLSTGNLGSDFAGSDVITFDGQVGYIKFFTKALTIEEFIDHTLNFKSIGLNNPTNNAYNTASAERLIIDASTDQQNKTTNANGELTIFDFSKNTMHLSGARFNATNTVIKNEDFNYSILSTFFDENQDVDKVKIHSFIEPDNINLFGTKNAPITQIDVNEELMTDPRFSIDFSIISALDEDIIKIMSTLNEYNNNIGNIENMFAFEYKDLDNLRMFYFNRLTDKINLKSFFEFFVWFDKNIGEFIKQLIPERVKFGDINYVIESHLLERPKFHYHSYPIYFNEIDRSPNSFNSVMEILENK